MVTTKSEAETLVPQFQLERILNQDQAGRRIVLYGTIKSKPGVLILERAPFASAPSYLSSIPANLLSIKNLGANDIYFWYMACSGPTRASTQNVTPPDPTQDAPLEALREDLQEIHDDLKINLIWPCTSQHVKKYSKQGVRLVTETPEIYRDYVRPYMQSKREEGRLNWVWNIIEGKTEVDDVIYRIPKGRDVERGFLLLPDLNWDRKTMESIHLLGLVERMDIWSLRDLRKKHVPWLKEMKERILDATVRIYEGKGVEEDQLKCYVHYQPTYYHFHVHVVHVALEAGATQAVGKAIGLDSIISQLESMKGEDQESGMDAVALTYTVGEASELWTDVFEPLKKKKGQQQNYRASQWQ